jgi:hypothetical protein
MSHMGQVWDLIMSHTCTAKKILFMYSFSGNWEVSAPCVCERFIYSKDRFTCISFSRIGRSIVGNIYFAHKHMNVEIGTWPRNSFSGIICLAVLVFAVWARYETYLQCMIMSHMSQVCILLAQHDRIPHRPGDLLAWYNNVPTWVRYETYLQSIIASHTGQLQDLLEQYGRVLHGPGMKLTCRVW